MNRWTNRSKDNGCVSRAVHRQQKRTSRLLTVEDAVTMTFSHRATKEKVPGLVAEDPLLVEAKGVLRVARNLGVAFWLQVALVCVGFATRCLPWFRHTRGFLQSLSSASVDVFELVSKFNSTEHLSKLNLEFTLNSNLNISFNLILSTRII